MSGDDVTEYPDGISEGHNSFPYWLWIAILIAAAFAWFVAPFGLFNP